MTEAGLQPSVAVLGQGEMGKALARALLADGFPLTVWNRTAAKCAPLAAAGARVAESASSAIAAAQIIVVCLGDYASVSGLLHPDDVSALLSGKTVVQLTTRTPREARLGEAWASRHGIVYLEGAIQGYPMHVGTPEGAILYAGLQRAFDSVRPVLLAMGGQATYVGERIGSAAALDLSMAGTVVPGAVLAFLHGASICEAEGAPIDLFFTLVQRHLMNGLVLDTMKASVDMIARRNYAYTGQGAPLDAWIGGLEMVGRCVQEAGVDTVYPNTLLTFLREAAAKGSGQDEMPAVFECFRRGDRVTIDEEVQP